PFLHHKRPVRTITDPQPPIADNGDRPCGRDRSMPVNKTALEPVQPHSCRHLRQPKSQTRGDDARPGGAAHQENEFCNNYSVISTRLCLFDHNRHRAFSITCNPTPRPKFRRVFAGTYISMRTIIPAQNVPRGTLYVQPWATRSAEATVGSCRNHLAGASGLAGWEGGAAFSLARDSSTRFLKSPLSSCSNPL